MASGVFMFSLPGTHLIFPLSQYAGSLKLLLQVDVLGLLFHPVPRL